MVYNETDLLPVWTRHYARQVGADYCFVIDHGSTEPVVVPPGVNVLRLPRSSHDDRRRAQFVGDLTRGLLCYFDWVIYSDVDELIVADPAFHANLPTFCADLSCDTLTCVGFDVQQVIPEESRLQLGTAIGKQRRWARFSGALCKPLVSRVSRPWSPGFHTMAGSPPIFATLYLFHLHWADRNLGQARLAKTRAMPWSDDVSGAHQRLEDSAWVDMFTNMAALPRRANIKFDLQSAPLQDWLSRFQTSVMAQQDESTAAGLDQNSPYLWEIPQRFRDIL